MPQLRAKCLRLYRRISQTDQLKHLNNTGKKYGQKVQKKRNPHPASPQEREEASGADYPFAGMQDNISCHRMKKRMQPACEPGSVLHMECSVRHLSTMDVTAHLYRPTLRRMSPTTFGRAAL